MSLEDRVKYAQMKARHKKKLQPWYLKTGGLLVLLLIAIFLSLIVASAIYVIKTAKNYNQELLVEENKRLLREYEEAIKGDIKNQASGPLNAPLTIVQFSDFACPFCADSADNILALKNLYSNQVRLIHRDFPQFPSSIDLAMGAHCAAEQKKFWEMYEQLFNNQAQLAILEEDELKWELISLSQELQLNSNLFVACLDEKRPLATIANDYRDAEFLQLEGTPVWFINNHKIVGHIPLDSFLELVETLLLEF